MIVDVHTHVWQSPEQLGGLELGEVARNQRRPGRVTKGTFRAIPAADAEHHYQQNAAVDRSIVLGFKSVYLKANIPNQYVADYVARFPKKLIGFAGIDPTESGAIAELAAARQTLHLRGLTISPPNQDFHPADTRAMNLYAKAEELGMPILVHPGGQFTEQSKMEFARPYLFDEVARTFPGLKIIFAQMGHPFVDETLCLLGKHQNVYADVSGLLRRPWQAYNVLTSAYQASVIDKLLFGSDFPYSPPTECIETLYSINQIVQGTNLPVIPRESLRGIVERETIGLLGLD